MKKPLVFVSTLITAVLLLSWTLFDNHDTKMTSSSFLTDNNKITDDEMLAFLTENSPGDDQPPAAEDVLVQRIAGDNNHLLLMAYYSRENYSKPSFTIENGFTITLRDDGKGPDKVAGDGLYTAKIPADVSAFRKQAISMRQKMKASDYKPVGFIKRQILIDPNAAENFELTSFDAYEPVSISGLTNALSEDFSPSAPVSGASSSSATSPSTTSSSISVTAAAVRRPTLLDSIKKNSTFITNLAVVEDPFRTWNYCTQTGNINGPWTFGTLMRQLASKDTTQIATDAQVSDFVKAWLNNWAVTQVINGEQVDARILVNSVITNPWLTKSLAAGAPAGQLDMRFAPFKLTAIVNRFDLRGGQKFGIPGSPCGEGRFVFCLINSDCSGPLRMTVIFEYGVNKPNTCEGQHAWAQQWVNLKNFSLGSPEYNQALQNITDQFSRCGTNPLKPNQSSLDQIRTNEVDLAFGSPKQWELREFILDNATGSLKQNTVGQNPALKYNAQVINTDVRNMVDYVTKNKQQIKAGKHIVPLTWKGLPFLGGAARIVGEPVGNPPNVFHWDGTDSTNKPTFIVDNDARSNFSLETCGGCHSGETQTSFTHIDPAFFGTEAGLSGFLTGTAGAGGAIDFDNLSTNGTMTVRDAALRPVTNPKTRNFNDINGRASGLRSFVSTTCGTTLAISSQLLFQPTNMVH